MAKSYHSSRISYSIVVLLIHALSLAPAQAQATWSVSSIQPVDSRVDAQTDLQWTLQSSVPISQNDCIQIEVPSPYTTDDPYRSFSTIAPFDCTIDSQPFVECTALASDKFQLKFTGPQTSTQTLLIGQTAGGVFRNPYSARRVSKVTVTHFHACDVDSTPLVYKQTQLSGLQLASIDSSQVKITSSSSKLAATDAVLSIKLSPTTSLKSKGRIMIKSPAWYQKEAIGQEGITEDLYTESMVADDTEVTISCATAVTVTSTSFDYSSNTLTIKYQAKQDILSSDSVVIEMTNFHNPVNTKAEVVGFQVSSADSLGYLMDQTTAFLVLETQMTESQTLNDINLKMLGDQNGLYEGMIVTLQTFQFSIGLSFPLEPFCYFELQFPETLQLEENVQSVKGTGIFTPTTTTNGLNPGRFGQFEVDSATNKIKIEGCRLPQYLTENPYGTFTIQSVRMPNYIEQLDPISVKVFADNTLTSLVIDDPAAVNIDMSDLMPGLFAVEMFKPSNFYASAQKVAYTLHVRPQHTLSPASRIVIELPELLTFDRKAGCEVIMTSCNCSLADDSNTLTLTNIFDADFPGGTMLKFIILSATNPLGSRPAGPWSIRSEVPINGTFYLVDGQQYEESFFALSGIILSTLSISNKQASNLNTVYDFQIRTEHNIPPNGKIIITFPPQTPTLPLSVGDIQESGLTIISVENNTVTILVEQGTNSDIPIEFSIAGVQNVRSLQPSSAFQISTVDLFGYVIDNGGQDIIVQMTEPASFNSVKIINPNKTNGAIVPLNISIDLQHELRQNDTLHIVLPADISFDQNVTCVTTGALVHNVTCSHSGAELQIKLLEVTREPGLLQIQVHGVKNPSSFKPSQPFQGIYTTDAQGYKSQTASYLQDLILQTDNEAVIQDYILAQDSEEYGAETQITLQFQTKNPISSDGVMLLTWPASVTVFDTTYCKVTTHKQILRQNTCVFDLSKRTLLIQGSFAEVPPSFTGMIQIGLSRIKNPETNENLEQYTLQTFDDPQFEYPVDILNFDPRLKCLWPCFNCGLTKDYCTACWSEPKYLLSQNQKSTCMDTCPVSWTSNGTHTPHECRQCDFTCAACQDIGLPGDVSRCTTCKPEYQFFLKVENNTGLCQAECSAGYYDSGNALCLKCSRNCDTCTGTSNNCTGCKDDSSVPVLMDERCIGECPSNHADILGICQQCESPCSSCEGQTDICTNCDGKDGLKFLFGLNCLTQCPSGTALNETKMKCEGCRTGCLICDIDNPSQCEKCQDGYLSMGDECVTTCPVGSVMTFSGQSCRSLSDIDARLVYFPFLITVALVALMSWIGKLVKPKHLFLTNFVIMLGLIEHVALVVQLILTFIFGTYLLAIFIVIIWVVYFGTLVAFNVLWRRDVINKDSHYQQYRDNIENQMSSRVRFVMGLFVNWRSHKLLYSHFFGVHVNAFKFSDGQAVGKLMYRILMVNVGATYVPLVLCNVVALATSVWGTQLYVMWIENIVIACVMTACCIIEHKQMTVNFLDQDRKEVNMAAVQRSIKGKKALFKFTPLMNESMNSHRYLFLQRKMDDLLELFGSRHCNSDFDHKQRERKETDPRLIRSFPMSPGLPPVDVDDPPRPLRTKLINNCFAQSFFEAGRTMKKLNGAGVNKSFQKGGPFDNDKHRADSYIVSVEGEYDEYQRTRDKKQRGRKNRVDNEIDSWDNKNGAVLDTDADGQSANYKLRAEFLSSIREEDEVLKKTKTIMKKLTYSNTKSTLSGGGVSPRKVIKREANNSVTSKAAASPRKATISTSDEKLKQSLSTSRISVEVSRLEHLALRGQNSTPKKLVSQNTSPKKQIRNVSQIKTAAKPVKIVQPSVSLRNFNENEVLGTVERDHNGKVKVHYTNGDFKDLVGRKVTSQGYLLDKDGDIISAQDPSHKVFRNLVDGQLPAPYLFEKYNFNAFRIFGNFTYLDPSDVTSLIKQKAMDRHAHLDDAKREVNSGGFLINKKGHIVDLQGRVVLDQVTKGGLIQNMFTWSAQTFQLTDVMGSFTMNESNQIVITEGSKDLSGHLVNDKGYLVNQNGDIVDRKGKVLFSLVELKNGEFPKIFKFSKFDIALIQGKFKLDENRKPILFNFPGGEFRDDDSRRTSARGYLIDAEGNIVDKGSNILLEKSLLIEDGRLPLLFRKILVSRHSTIDNDDDEFSNLLQQIEEDLDQQLVQGQTIQELENSKQDLSRDQHRKVANRTFNNQSPGGRLASDRSRSSDGNSSSSPNRRFQSKQKFKLVKQESMHEKDVVMANVYGGEAVPRVRMIPKRFQTNIRERPSGQVLRDSSILSPNQMILSQEITSGQRQMPSMLDLPNVRTRTQLDRALQPDIMSQTGRESNAAISVKNLHQLRKQMLGAKESTQDQPHDHLPQLYQGQAQDEMNKFMDGFNFQLQSMGDFSEQLSNGTFAEINVPSEQLTKQLLDKNTKS